jgi:8-oxo-dGTP pyrophosphatase MutT (NUDIX family)
MKYREAVFVVTYARVGEDVEYLLLKRKLHWRGWEFPKGGREKGERLGETVRRELREETGLEPLEIKNLRAKGKYRYHKVLKDRPGYVGQTYTLFSARVKKGAVRFDKVEHAGYKWVGFEEAMKKLTWESQKKCLKIVDERLRKKFKQT